MGTDLSIRRLCCTLTPLLHAPRCSASILMALSVTVNIRCQNKILEPFTSRLSCVHSSSRSSLQTPRPKCSNGGKSPMHSPTPGRVLISAPLNPSARPLLGCNNITRSRAPHHSPNVHPVLLCPSGGRKCVQCGFVSGPRTGAQRPLEAEEKGNERPRKSTRTTSKRRAGTPLLEAGQQGRIWREPPPPPPPRRRT